MPTTAPFTLENRHVDRPLHISTEMTSLFTNCRSWGRELPISTLPELTETVIAYGSARLTDQIGIRAGLSEFHVAPACETTARPPSG